MRALWAVLLALGCKSTEQVRTPAPDLETDHLGASHQVARHDPARSDHPSPDASIATSDAAPLAAVSSGVDFSTQAALLYRIAACGGADRVPSSYPARDKVVPIVERHCKNLLERIAQFRAAYFEKHRPWFAGVVPADAPKTVVYPFGGGDLLSALVAFPDATEVTTISLELAGDPRRIATLSPAALAASLAALRVEIGGLLSVASNTSVNLSAQQRNELPGQVVSFLIALVAGGYEPVAMRYFSLDERGAIVYLDQAAIDASERRRGKPLKGDWVSPNFSEAFSHVELTYRRPGDSALRVHRHFGWNLADDQLALHPELVRHLEAKGQVTVLVKGASYLLHRPNFATIRNYLLGHLGWMLSDSTGVPPSYAQPANMVQETYGSYSGAFLEGARGTRADQSFVDLWRRNPYKKLGFRFGYVDASGAGHLVVTRPAGQPRQ